MRLPVIFVLALAAGTTVAYLWLGGRTDAPRVADAPAAAPAPVSEAPPPALEDARAAGTDALTALARPARESESREEIRGLLARAFAGRLTDRELTDEDYDQLVDATVRLRSALRVLRDGAQSKARAAAQTRQRQIVRASLAEIEDITGVAPGDLGTVFGSDDGAAIPE